MRSHNEIASGTIVIDENQVHVLEPLDYQVMTSNVRVIIRMPSVPSEYFQIAKFSTWYEQRISELKAYAIRQNAKHIEKSISFDVLVGSKYDVLRQSKERTPAVRAQCPAFVC